MTTKLNIADSASASRRAANRESGELLLHSEKRGIGECSEAQRRERRWTRPCRQISGERPTELALLNQVVRSEFFAERNYMAVPDIAGEFDCEESPKTKAAEDSPLNCCIVPEIRKEIHTHGLQVHCRLAGRRQCTN